jgi:hypothetical protein
MADRAHLAVNDQVCALELALPHDRRGMPFDVRCYVAFAWTTGSKSPARSSWDAAPMRPAPGSTFVATLQEHRVFHLSVDIHDRHGP